MLSLCLLPRSFQKQLQPSSFKAKVLIQYQVTPADNDTLVGDKTYSTQGLCSSQGEWREEQLLQSSPLPKTRQDEGSTCGTWGWGWGRSQCHGVLPAQQHSPQGQQRVTQPSCVLRPVLRLTPSNLLNPHSPRRYTYHSMDLEAQRG